MSLIIKQYLLFNNNNNNLEESNLIDKNIMIYDNINHIDHSLLDLIKDINLENIIWKYDENNLRIPYIKRIYYENSHESVSYQKIKYYKLKQNDNILDFISSMQLIDDYNIISGEKIQNLADIVLGSNNSINWNPNNIFYSKNITMIDKIVSLDKYKSIFVFTHDLELFYSKFKENIDNKIIISHNSDHEINFIENVKLHLAQNCLINSPNLISIPIGIENMQWFDHNIFHKVRKININKSKNIYFYFSLTTHKTREECYNKLKNILEWNVKKTKEEYFKELACHKYAICPRGNGLDTHRIWECLYLNVIPIIIKNDFPNIENLPIIILDNWDQIANLPNEFINQKLSKLSVIYYDKIIKDL